MVLALVVVLVLCMDILVCILVRLLWPPVLLFRSVHEESSIVVGIGIIFVITIMETVSFYFKFNRTVGCNRNTCVLANNTANNSNQLIFNFVLLISPTCFSYQAGKICLI